MRIAVFDDLPEGGAKRVAYEHVKRLALNHEVYYFSNNLPTRFPFERHASDVFRFELDLWQAKGGLRPLSEWSYQFTYRQTYQKISEMVQQLEVDVVLVHPSKLTQCPELTRFLTVPSVYFGEEWLRIVYEPEKHPLPLGLKGRYEQWRRQWLKKLICRQLKRPIE